MQIKLMTIKERVWFVACFIQLCQFIGGLPGNDLFLPINHLLVNSLPVLTVSLSPHLWVEALKRNSCDIHPTPHRHCRKQTEIYTLYSQRHHSNTKHPSDALSSCGCVKRFVTGPTVRVQQMADRGFIFSQSCIPLESPCSPIIQPWQLEGWR